MWTTQCYAERKAKKWDKEYWEDVSVFIMSITEKLTSE